jgi:hypothetical protein
VKRVRRRESAQTLALAAVMMVAVIGFLAIVLDVGLLWLTQRELQKTADSAAIAGVVLLPADPSGAEAQARWYVEQNQGVAEHLCSALPIATITPGEIQLPNGTGYTLTVTMQCTAGFIFGQVVGDSQSPRNDLHIIPNDCGCLRASATAVIGSNASPGCPLPLAISDINEGIDANGNPAYWGQPGATWQQMQANGSGYAFGQLVALHVDNQGSTSGNFHAIQFAPGTGAQVYESELSNKCSSSPNIQPGGWVITRPGDMTGPTRIGLLGRGLVRCTGSAQPLLCTNQNYPPYPPSPTPTHDDFTIACPDNPIDLGPNDHSGILNPNGSVKRNSPCLAAVIVVVPGALNSGNGQYQVQVEGFAGFFIAGWVQRGNVVWGMFAKDAPTVGDLGGYDPFGTIVMRLIR